MKNLFKKFLAFCESLGRARAATTLTRQGKFEEARQVMLSK